MHWSGDIKVLFGPLRDLALRSSNRDIRSVMQDGVPHLRTDEYDNWNGGTTYYTLVISVSMPIFAEIEARVESIETEILKKIERIQREDTHDFIRGVIIKPEPEGFEKSISAVDCRFWLPDHFRLFVSHLSKDKMAANRLKRALQRFGICAFVAHEDIEPTKDWEDEIERALFSLDALAAIISPDFGKSKWTDHEVGVALGRNKVVLPLLYGQTPYGLIGKYQGLPAKGRPLAEVSQATFLALLNNNRTNDRLLTSLTNQICQSDSAEIAIEKIRLIDMADNIPSEFVLKIREAVGENEKKRPDRDSLVAVTNEFLRKRGQDAIRPDSENGDDIPF